MSERRKGQQNIDPQIKADAIHPAIVFTARDKHRRPAVSRAARGSQSVRLALGARPRREFVLPRLA